MLVCRTGVFAVVWGLLLPVVIAQSLVAALDDGAAGISAQDVVAPLLFLLGVFFTASVVVSFSHVSDFQVSEP